MKTSAFIVCLLVVFGLSAQNEKTGQEISKMTVEQFKKRTGRTDKLVYVNFVADWCVVCKREKSTVDSVAAKYKNLLELLVIDMDENPLIAEYFEVDGLPVHLLYKGGILVWNRTGMLKPAELESMIRGASKK